MIRAEGAHRSFDRAALPDVIWVFWYFYTCLLHFCLSRWSSIWPLNLIKHRIMLKLSLVCLLVDYQIIWFDFRTQCSSIIQTTRFLNFLQHELEEYISLMSVAGGWCWDIARRHMLGLENGWNNGVSLEIGIGEFLFHMIALRKQ